MLKNKIENLKHYGSTKHAPLISDITTDEEYYRTSAETNQTEGFKAVCPKRSFPGLLIQLSSVGGKKVLDIVDTMGEWLAEFFFSQPKVWYQMKDEHDENGVEMEDAGEGNVENQEEDIIRDIKEG